MTVNLKRECDIRHCQAVGALPYVIGYVHGRQSRNLCSEHFEALDIFGCLVDFTVPRGAYRKTLKAVQEGNQAWIPV